MKSKSLKPRFPKIVHLLFAGVLCGTAACHPVDPAGKTASNDAANRPAAQNSAAASTTSQAENQTADTPVLNVGGTYKLNNHRAGREGYENSLTVTHKAGGRIHVAFEGNFFFEANGAETFHETTADGELPLKGNTASGRIVETYTENGCAIELNFSGERVNLKSTNCDLNVTPDGVYQKGGGETNDETTDASRDEAFEQGRVKADEYYDPFVQYDRSGAPEGIVNLMQREGEREGCEEDVVSYTGEVKKVDYIGDYVYEFTLASDNRKPQKISLVLAAEDRLPFDDVRSIIRRGNHLEVTFIYCGNAPIATPTAIYKR